VSKKNWAQPANQPDAVFNAAFLRFLALVINVRLLFGIVQINQIITVARTMKVTHPARGGTKLLALSF
jgi:hypothetical protein